MKVCAPARCYRKDSTPVSCRLASQSCKLLVVSINISPRYTLGSNLATFLLDKTELVVAKWLVLWYKISGLKLAKRDTVRELD